MFCAQGLHAPDSIIALLLLLFSNLHLALSLVNLVWIIF